jgi:hypothetical protein
VNDRRIGRRFRSGKSGKSERDHPVLIANIEGSFPRVVKDSEGNILGIEQWRPDDPWGKVARTRG